MIESKIQNNYTLNKKITFSKVTNRYVLNRRSVRSDKLIKEVKYLCTMYGNDNAYNIPLTALNYNETMNEDGDLTGNLQLSIPYPENIEEREGILLVNMDSVIVRQYRDFTDNTFESFFISRSLITNGNYQIFRESSNLNLNCSVNTYTDSELTDFQNNNSEFNWTESDNLVYVDKIVSRQTTNEGDILFDVPSKFFTRAGKYFVYNGQQYKCKRLSFWVSRSGSTVQLLGSLQ